MKITEAGMIAVALLAGCSALNAQVTGHLSIVNCNGGGVTVTLTTITWLPPAGGGTGCINTGINTSLVFNGGTLGPGANGAILNLTLNPAFPPVNMFMTFSGKPLNFVLTTLGPGSANTNCSIPNMSCSVTSGSPFLLQPVGSNTEISLNASGTVSDGTTPPSTWSGAFTTQIAGQTPAQLQAAFLANNQYTATYSAEFTITPPPPPGRNCTLTQGGYKNHFNDLVLNFPAGGLTLGTVFYTNVQLNSILQDNAIKGNGLLSLAHQLITADLNLAYGAVPSDPTMHQTLTNAIASANALIGNLVIPPVGSGSLPTSATSSIESVLDNYNNGGLGVPHCQ